MATTVSGSNLVTEQEVIDAIVPFPTKSYQPVENGKFIALLRETAEMFGLELTNPTFGFNNAHIQEKERQQVFGTFEIEGQDHMGDAVKLMLGWRNSYDKSLAAGVCFGSQVYVCSNLIFTGYAGDDNEIFGTVFHKHTVNVNDIFPERLKRALSQFEKFRQFQDSFYTRLHNTEIDDNMAYSSIVRAVMGDVIPNKNIKKVVEEWHYQEARPDVVAEDRPWHSEFKDRSAFSLLNAFTEVAKEDQIKNAVRSSSRDIATSKFFHDEFVGAKFPSEDYAI